ncbi:MAG: cytochrome c3 family protein [Terriglobia bacterium]
MRKSKVALAMVVIALAAATIALAQNQKSTVIGTVHDVAGNGCLSCHAPHNGSVATGGTDQQTGQILLWDRGFTAQTFGTYDSPSLDNTPAEVGGTPISATEPRLFSFLCLSCHDGVTSPTLIGPTVPEAVGNPTNSFGLTNDHPINMSFDPAQDAGLNPVATVTAAGLPLYGATSSVQCASCHNVHDSTNAPFLRISNASSGLCTTCHL